MSKTPDRKPRLLVVEDDDLQAELQAQWLKKDFEPHRVSTLQAAREAMLEHGADIALLDLNLPDAKDLEALQHLRAGFPQLPIVVLSACEKSEVAEQALETGAEDFLPKHETSPRRLAEVLQAAVGRHQGREFQRQLEEAEHLAAVARLAGIVTHQVNNPLTWAVGSLDLMREALESPDHDPEELRRLVERCSDGVHRVRSAIADLAAFIPSQTDEEPEAVRVAALVASSIELLDPVLGDWTITQDFQESARCIVRPRQIGQVVHSMILSCVEHSEKSDHRLELTVTSDAQHVTFQIRIPHWFPSPGESRRIFQPFFSSKAGKAGPGLFVASRIAERYQGTLQMRSGSVEGTTLRLQLPTAPEAPLTETPAPSRKAITPSRILIVDDESLLLEILQEALGQDFEIVTALGGPEAQRILAEDTGFDLVLCDLGMPEIDGVDLWHAASEALRERFLFMTGGLYSDKFRGFLSAEKPTVISKPFRATALREEIERFFS